MELRFDHDQWLMPAPAPTLAPAPALQGARASVASPLWPVLAARLAAGHALWRDVLSKQAEPAAPRRAAAGGSFHAGIARIVAAYGARAAGNNPPLKGYPAINPVILGDGKTMSGTNSSVAGASNPAIEG